MPPRSLARRACSRRLEIEAEDTRRRCNRQSSGVVIRVDYGHPRMEAPHAWKGSRPKRSPAISCAQRASNDRGAEDSELGHIEDRTSRTKGSVPFPVLRFQGGVDQKLASSNAMRSLSQPVEAHWFHLRRQPHIRHLARVPLQFARCGTRSSQSSDRGRCAWKSSVHRATCR